MSIKVTTLANGLRVASDTIDGAESVVIGAWVGVGTRHEAWRANGIAHMAEHMFFKGTKKRSAYTISKTIEKNGGEMNAHTTREETAFYARVLPEDKERAMDIIADMLLRSVFDPKELDRERQVIIQEIGRDRDTPEDYIFDLMHETAFPRQKIGRSILGTTEIVERVPREELLNYVRKYYHTGNIVIVGAGKIDHEDLVALVRRYFRRLPAGKPAKIERARIQKGDLRVAKDSEQLHIMMSFAAPGLHAPKAHVAGLLASILGGTPSSRLFQKVREKRGLVYNIGTYHMPFQDVGLFSLYAGTDPSRVKELIPVVCRELRQVTKNITESELNRAKAQARAELLMDQDSVMRRAEILGHHILAYNEPIPMQDTIGEIMKVTVDQTRSMASKILSKAPIITALGPIDNVAPYQDIVAQMRG
ncbi:MAG: M16 family metallopeptidase [Bdellovibrionales bacterium]